MGAYKTKALTKEQYTQIIETIKVGFLNIEPNKQVATILVLESNLRGKSKRRCKFNIE